MVIRSIPIRPAKPIVRRRGVLLVDIIVAVVILAVAVSVLIGLTTRALRSQRQGEQLQLAAMLADEQLNLVLARGPDNYGSRFGGLEGTCDEPFQQYRYKLDFTGGTGGDPYNVVATVMWLEGDDQRSIFIETRIAPRLGDQPDPDRKPQETLTRP